MPRIVEDGKNRIELDQKLREYKKTPEYWIELIKCHAGEIESLSKLPLMHREIVVHNDRIKFCVKKAMKILEKGKKT
jgi:hypothetical protein